MEEKQPEASESLRKIAESYAQQNPTFNNPIAYTRMTASEARKQLKLLGYKESQIPCLSTMAVVLNRMGYRLRKVVKAKAKKNPRNRCHLLKLKENKNIFPVALLMRIRDNFILTLEVLTKRVTLW